MSLKINKLLALILIFFLSFTICLGTEKFVHAMITNNNNLIQEENNKPKLLSSDNILSEKIINVNNINKQRIERNKQFINSIPNNTVKPIVGIYLSRYQATNNASEKNIREKVRYYRSKGFNTIIHGVAANGCTYYESSVTQRRFGYTKCPEIHPNEFKSQWLNWLIDEAHKQGMQVYAYFEKGIKLDQNSPILNLAIQNNWLLSKIDKTYTKMDHYLLDVNIPEVANYYTELMREFAQQYPTIDAVQWDDYLGYHSHSKSTPQQTAILTKFVQNMIKAVKNTTPSIKFDICHHNPYWAAQYFAADWKKWGVDQIFIQAYNDKNFGAEVRYAEQFKGLAITDRQLHRLKEIINNKKIQGLLIFPLQNEQSKETAARFNQYIQREFKRLW